MATKDVPDRLVCIHVQRYQDAMKPLFEEGRVRPRIYGMGASEPSPPFPYETLAAETSEPEKVCYRAMERAERHGLIECGVSLRTGWLTEKGKGLIR
jgi:hypothetical protein